MKTLVIARGGGFLAVQKSKLNIRFHNPNSAGETAAFLLPILIEANKLKLEQILRESARQENAIEEKRCLSM